MFACLRRSPKKYERKKGHIVRMPSPDNILVILTMDENCQAWHTLHMQARPRRVG